MANHQLQNIVELFNNHSRSNLLLTKRCSELKEDKHYSIHFFKRVDTTHGEGLIAALSDSPYREGDEPKFQVFLPKRFVHLLQNEDLENISPGSLYLVSHGQSGSRSTELTLHLSTNLSN